MTSPDVRNRQLRAKNFSLLPMEEFDIAAVGSGLAGPVAAREAADRGRGVVVLEQEGGPSPGGQASLSLGGLFFAGADRRGGEVSGFRYTPKADSLTGAQAMRADMPKLIAVAALALFSATPALADTVTDPQIFGKGMGGVVRLARLQANGWAYLRP